MASREPVDAPDGTAARPMVPDSSSTSHSTVGLPRLSRISRPTMSTMALIQSLRSSVVCCGRTDDAAILLHARIKFLRRALSAGKVVLEQRLRLDHAVER